jgi:hypothetical protein
VRRNDGDSYFGRVKLTTNEAIEMIVTTDIDISCDGKRWFHLLGSQCLRHEKPFYTSWLRTGAVKRNEQFPFELAACALNAEFADYPVAGMTNAAA